MIVKVLLFGPAAQAAGTPDVEITCADGATADDVRAALGETLAPIAEIARTGRLAINGAFSPGNAIVGEHDEVALIAMVSGG